MISTKYGEEIQTVSMASFEAAQHRHQKTVRTLIAGWFASVAVLGVGLIIALL